MCSYIACPTRRHLPRPGRRGEVPGELEGIIEAVLGLDDRPQATTHFRLRTGGKEKRQPHAPAAAVVPARAGGGAVRIPEWYRAGPMRRADRNWGGFVPADLHSYFAGAEYCRSQGHGGVRGSGPQQPDGNANGPDGEVMLDIEMVGSIAPSCSIAVYFAPNTVPAFSMPSPPRYTIRE